MRSLLRLPTLALTTLAISLGLGACACKAQAPASAAPSEHQLVSLLYKTHAGLTLNYVEGGDPAGTTLVLLHGAGDSWHSYERVFPLLPPSYHVFAITMRGHGLSDHPETGFSTADFAGDIEDFLSAKDLHHVVLVGHSLGSFVAQKVAEDDTAGRLDKLVLIGSGPGMSKAPPSSGSPLSAFAKLQDPVPFTFARDFQASTIYFPVPAQFFELWVAEAQRLPASTWHGLAQGHRELTENIRKIRVPTLVLWGEKDSIFHKADEDLLVQTLPHPTFIAYPETGHALHWERPERFTRDLVAFVNRVADSTGK